MSEQNDLPPSYEQLGHISIEHNSNPNWRAWFDKLIGLGFNSNEAIEYTNLFVQNDVNIRMISDLNDSILKTMGIEKAGHRIRILYLQNANSSHTSPNPQPVINFLKCANHPAVIANEKCRRCNRLLCLLCRREKSKENYPTRYYCQDCCTNEDCILL